MLENAFMSGYHDRDMLLYIFIFNQKEESIEVTDEISSTWDENWKNTNTRLEELLAWDHGLVPF